ncbi:hypothetical protein B0H16DRAFT_1594707 [Mycena metata]|uniref:Uncharacterized protein n=1 Tax=Mycena metata TaxID=1033252 RepID=A0AAD7MNN2_9AGAR|nr:hypothetical protein B0H16DRAFT_1594707 [Mycena metata]
MDTHLPDEILSEILSPALKVSDDEFSDTSPNSPFARYSESSSAFLLVCKAWLRVATPLLYHVVVLRSKAQASALDSALRRNSDLGRWVKKLRVEGGYGPCMLKIIAAVPNVTDLFISVDIWSSDNVVGLIKGNVFPPMNPTRVVLYDPPYGRRRNKNSEALVQVITRSIKDWKNLSVFELSSSYASSTTFAIAASLRVAPALKTIVTPISHGIFSQFPPEHLVIMAKNPSLERIQLKPARARFGMSIPSAGFLSPPHPSFRGLIVMPEIDTPGSVQSLAPPSRSIQYSTASVPDDIWKRILYFAAAPDIQGSKWIPHSRSRLVLVSKKFARLSLPYLKETLYFRSPFTFDNLGPALKSDLSFRLTRNLYIDNNANLNLRPVFSCPLVNIIGLTTFYVSAAVFSELAKKCGQTLVCLEGLIVAKGNKPLESSVFAQFINIRSLALGFKSSFAKSTSTPSNTLSMLEQLKITHCDRTLVTVLLEMDLPALREVTFQVDNAHELDLGTFLAKHGSKLRRVTLPNFGFLNIFNVCPAVVDLTISCGGGTPNASLYTCTTPHPSLQTITFKTDTRSRGAERKWAGFFDFLSVLTFPALRQIALPCIKWPTTEHDIGKSLWVQWAERLLDRNVTLVDANGVGWRRRLKK